MAPQLVLKRVLSHRVRKRNSLFGVENEDFVDEKLEASHVMYDHMM
jgi:hypothetical protein